MGTPSPDPEEHRNAEGEEPWNDEGLSYEVGDTIEEPSAESRSPEESIPEDSDSATVDVNVSGLHGDHAQVIGTQHQEFHQTDQHWNVFLQEKADALVRRNLSMEALECFSEDHILEHRRDLIADRAELLNLTTQLEDKRWVILEAEAGVGKTQLSILTAAALLDRAGISKLWRNRIPIDKSLDVDLESLIQDNSRDLKGSLIVLRDAFQQDNIDLNRLALESDSLTAQRLQQTLLECNAFLILTRDRGGSDALSSHLSSYRFEAKGPDSETKREFLRARGMTLIPDPKQEEPTESPQKRFLKLVEANGLSWVEILGGVGVISTFLTSHLHEILESQNPQAVVEAFVARRNRVDHWIEDHRDDLEVQALLVALALSHSHPSRDAVKWRVFERFRLRILQKLRQDLGIDEPRSPACLVDEPLLFDRFEVALFEDQKGLFLHFEDPERIDQLWASLLGPGRRLLATAEPVLAQICTEHDTGSAQTAAYALVRLGRLDPNGFVLSRLSRWMTLGYGEDHRAIRATRHLLRAATESGSTYLIHQCAHRVVERLKRKDLKRVEAGLWALAAIGDARLQKAMGHLRDVVDERLVPALEALREVDMQRRLKELEVSRSSGDRQLSRALSKVNEVLLVQLLAQLFKDSGSQRIYGACSHILAGWILEHGAIQIFKALDRWMPDGDEGYEAAILAMMFIGSPDISIFETLRSFPEPQSSGQPIDRVVYGARKTPNGVSVWAKFLFKLYLGIRHLPPLFQRVLRRGLWTEVETHVEQAILNPHQGPATSELLQRLKRMPDLEFQDQVEDLLIRLQEQGLLDSHSLSDKSWHQFKALPDLPRDALW